MPNQIPTRTRELVAARDMGHCLRCGAEGHQAHHRRRRREKDGHEPHCVCNVVTLCSVCHPWAHGHPEAAKRFGWIVPPWLTPDQEPVMTWLYGWAYLTCEAMFILAAECENCDQPHVLEAGLCVECLAKAVAEGEEGLTLALERLRERLTREGLDR